MSQYIFDSQVDAYRPLKAPTVVTHVVTAVVAAAVALGMAAVARGEFDAAQHQEVSVPICQTEDGSDVDGLCFWIDPDTGDMYLNPTDAEVQRSLNAAGWEYVGGFN